MPNVFHIRLPTAGADELIRLLQYSASFSRVRVEVSGERNACPGFPISRLYIETFRLLIVSTNEENLNGQERT